MDSKGNITSHLSGLFSRTVNMLQKGIKPVFVFDGQPPELKRAERARRRALKEEAQQKYDEAVGEFQEILKFDSNNREAKLTLGLIYLERDQYEQAIEEFILLLKDHPDDHRVRYLLALTYEEKKAYEPALEEFKKITADSDLYGSALIRIGVILKGEGKIDEAIAVIREAINNKKEWPELYFFLSFLYEEEKKLSAACDCFDCICERDKRRQDDYGRLRRTMRQTANGRRGGCCRCKLRRFRPGTDGCYHLHI